MNNITNNNDINNKKHLITTNVTHINSKKNLLMESLIIFYRNEENLAELLPIINGESKISLRLLDWFVTNYSKKNSTRYTLIKKDKKINFIVYLDYKSQLTAYNKEFFDPFCRKERIRLLDNNNEEIITTVGQLNFFKWAINNDILKYIYKNHDVILNDMVVSLNNLYKKNKKDDVINTSDNNTIIKKTRRKRQEISVNAAKKINKQNVVITVDFN